MTDKCCVFNCRSNYDSSPKETFFFFPDEKKHYDLRKLRIRFVNREGWKPSKKSYICRKHFEPHYCKTGTNGKRHRLIKKLNPVPTIFDPEESHLSTESKCLKSPVSVPRKSATKRVYQQDQFKLFEVQDKIKSLIILILRWHLRGMYFRNMRIMLFFTTLKLMCWTSQK